MSTIIYQYTIPVRPTTYPLYHSATDKICRIIGELMGIDPELMYVKCRKKKVKYSRWMAWEILISGKNCTLKEAGEILGGCDHTSVIHGLNQLQIDLSANEYLQLIYVEVLRRMDISMDTIMKSRMKRELRRQERNNRQP